MRWGLIPFWAKDASISYKMINVHGETVSAWTVHDDLTTTVVKAFWKFVTEL